MINSPDIFDLKTPPSHVDLEEAVLGALLLEGESYFRIGNILKPEMFYKDSHRMIYEAIQIFGGINCDLLTITAKLKEQKKLVLIGGPYFLTQLTSKVASSAHLESHVSYIEDAWKSRECIRISSQISQAAFEGSVEDISRMEMEMNEVVTGSRQQDIVHISDTIDKSTQAIIDVSNGTKKIIGIPTGYKTLDRFTYGLQSPDLIVIAARPSMGKTALALCIARNVAENCPVLFDSMEMSKYQLDYRLLSMESRIDSNRFKSQGGLNIDQMKKLEAARDRIRALNLFVDDTPAQHINEIKNKARRAVRLHGIKLLIVDYIQLARGTAKNRDQEVGQISQGLKALAKELDIPVIAISQLNRQTENRSGRRPNLSDLRESGQIEQDADIVMFVHRPERYKIDVFDDGSSTKGMVQLIFEKHRNGATGDLLMKFIGNLTLFEDVDLEEIGSDYLKDKQSRLFDQTGDDSPF